MLREMSRRRYPPMTLDELRTIACDAPSPVVKRLLWEIRRLQVVEARAADVIRALDSPGPTHATTVILVQTLKDALLGDLPG